MFFTPELLSRRDSGFGLLWLAATLGAKSSFRKLPRRSVLTADIAELCTLIAEPAEPLALRLSSNLMMGVTRVYKVKQEILLTDVTTCYNTLKKAVQEIHAASFATAQLQMGHPNVRPETVTAITDPTVAFALDFDHLFGGWGEPLTQTQRRDQGSESDEDYDPTQSRSKKPRSKARSASVAEQPRAGAHTLQEDHSHLFSNSLEESFHDGLASSSQVDGFHFDDNFLDGLDLGGGIGDELAKELGEGWGVSANDPLGLGNAPGLDMSGMADFGGDFHFDEGQNQFDLSLNAVAGNSASHSSPSMRNGLQTGQAHASEGSIVLPLAPLSPVLDLDEQALADGQIQPERKTKRVRLLLDSRTELTNEELERARTHYMEEQAELRRGMEQKRMDKESGKLIEEMIWGAPRGVNAPVLIDFWVENFKVQVEARSGRLHIHTEGEPPRKRRKTAADAAQEQLDADMPWDLPAPMDVDQPRGDVGYDDFRHDIDIDSRMRSSEEPGQARRVSRQPSLLGSQFELAVGAAHDPGSGSQRSNLFPWDHAGASSSVSGIAFKAGASDIPSFGGRADSRLRGSSLTRDSLGPVVPESPASFGLTASHRGDGFEFDVPAEDPSGLESQLSDASVMTLERNSFNFLEYAKMQLNAFPSATSTVKFNDVVPAETSTRRVASAAFYHCLVLATKDLLGVRQAEPYGAIEIVIK